MRPVWWRQNDLYVVTAISGVLLFGASHRPSQLLSVILFTTCLYGVFIYGIRRASLRVNDDTLTITDLLGKPRSTSAAQVRQVRIYSYWIVMSDGAGKEVARTRPLWSRQQLGELAKTLNAELVDRRRRHRVAR